MAYTTINDPSAYFQTVLWAGDDSDPRTITFGGNSNLQPDLVITKTRNDTNSWHTVDSSRGTTNASAIALDRTEEEGGLTNGNTQLYGYISAITSNGFTVVDGSNTTSYNYNKSGTNFVGYGWKGASSGISVSESGTSDDSLNACTHYANQDAGFSIVKFTGNNGSISNGEETRVTHGLGAVPEFIIIKSRDTAQSWVVQQDDNWNDSHLVLNTSAAPSGSLYTGNHASTTSAYFIVGNADLVNKADDEFIAYVWKGVQGYSKIGVYTGNANADGQFIYTGFKPAFVLTKKTYGTSNWHLSDNARGTYNPVSAALMPDQYYVENTTLDQVGMDFLSNGFKFRGANDTQNGAGTYIYMAFAEQPFVTSSGVPATAR